MKFSKNKLYVEAYIKCVNCGILIFDDQKENAAQSMLKNGKVYCSSWCVDWEMEREARRAAEAADADACRQGPREPAHPA